VTAVTLWSTYVLFALQNNYVQLEFFVTVNIRTVCTTKQLLLYSNTYICVTLCDSCHTSQHTYCLHYKTTMCNSLWQISVDIVVTVNTLFAPQNNYVQLFVTVNTLFAQPNNCYYVLLFVTAVVVTVNWLLTHCLHHKTTLLYGSWQSTYVVFALQNNIVTMCHSLWQLFVTVVTLVNTLFAPQNQLYSWNRYV